MASSRARTLRRAAGSTVPQLEFFSQPRRPSAGVRAGGGQGELAQPPFGAAAGRVILYGNVGSSQDSEEACQRVGQSGGRGRGRGIAGNRTGPTDPNVKFHPLPSVSFSGKRRGASAVSFPSTSTSKVGAGFVADLISALCRRKERRYSAVVESVPTRARELCLTLTSCH